MKSVEIKVPRSLRACKHCKEYLKDVFSQSKTVRKMIFLLHPIFGLFYFDILNKALIIIQSKTSLYTTLIEISRLSVRIPTHGDSCSDQRPSDNKVENNDHEIVIRSLDKSEPKGCHIEYHCCFAPIKYGCVNYGSNKLQNRDIWSETPQQGFPATNYKYGKKKVSGLHGRVNLSDDEDDN